MGANWKPIKARPTTKKKVKATTKISCVKIKNRNLISWASDQMPKSKRYAVGQNIITDYAAWIRTVGMKLIQELRIILLIFCPLFCLRLIFLGDF